VQDLASEQWNGLQVGQQAPIIRFRQCRQKTILSGWVLDGYGTRSVKECGTCFRVRSGRFSH
jgi:hypothetical protein